MRFLGGKRRKIIQDNGKCASGLGTSGLGNGRSREADFSTARFTIKTVNRFGRNDDPIVDDPLDDPFV
jgi:hypothetical protein